MRCLAISLLVFVVRVSGLRCFNDIGNIEECSSMLFGVDPYCYRIFGDFGLHPIFGASRIPTSGCVTVSCAVSILLTVVA